MHTFLAHSHTKASLNHTLLFIRLTVAGMQSTLATPQLKLDVSVLLAYLHLLNDLSRHSSRLMDCDKRLSLMADKCKGVKTDAFLTVTSASLTDRAACSQRIQADTGHDYVTLEAKREYY